MDVVPRCLADLVGNAPVIGHPLGVTQGKGGDFVQDPV